MCCNIDLEKIYAEWKKLIIELGFPGGSVGKEFTCSVGDCLQYRRARFNPWMGKFPWRKKWQPPPVFLSGKFLGQRSLVGYNPWSHKESDTTKLLTPSLSKLSQRQGSHLSTNGLFSLSASCSWSWIFTVTPNRYPWRGVYGDGLKAWLCHKEPAFPGPLGSCYNDAVSWE